MRVNGLEAAGPFTGFRVRRATRLAALPLPGSVGKGGQIAMAGVVERLEPITLGRTDFGGYRAQPVRIYFRPTGGDDWIFKGLLWSGGGGAFVKAFRAYRSGTWQARYPGNSYYAAADSIPLDVTVR